MSLQLEKCGALALTVVGFIPFVSSVPGAIKYFTYKNYAAECQLPPLGQTALENTALKIKNIDSALIISYEVELQKHKHYKHLQLASLGEIIPFLNIFFACYAFFERCQLSEIKDVNTSFDWQKKYLDKKYQNEYYLDAPVQDLPDWAYEALISLNNFKLLELSRPKKHKTEQHESLHSVIATNFISIIERKILMRFKEQRFEGERNQYAKEFINNEIEDFLLRLNNFDHRRNYDRYKKPFEESLTYYLPEIIHEEFKNTRIWLNKFSASWETPQDAATIFSKAVDYHLF